MAAEVVVMRQSVLLCCWENERALEALAQCSPVAWPVIGPGGKVCGCSVAHTDPSSWWAAAVSRSRTQQQTSDNVQTTGRQRRWVSRVEGGEKGRRCGGPVEEAGAAMRCAAGSRQLEIHTTAQGKRGAEAMDFALLLAWPAAWKKLVPKSVRQLPSERLNHDCFRARNALLRVSAVAKNADVEQVWSAAIDSIFAPAAFYEGHLRVSQVVRIRPALPQSSCPPRTLNILRREQ
ncbi:hypothetical protein M409DRAFT_52103 [Zasmidium cellare ATCC 36951]|uniref:Uncharacterized protein n=1 Tax=Zasmidium cellare ATCC 36951 TaxID=1080233 RepID=A0A6A6CTQ7_ZASCE|nr:uncharacterized protein M409DRAFT_52103 [Zasmidium cellare ATCC 36951]KAF2169568.1 hypothetical protein M409DRAFT_52103 [Zasmidium cellare ATCC 36951]